MHLQPKGKTGQITPLWGGPIFDSNEKRGVSAALKLNIDLTNQ